MTPEALKEAARNELVHALDGQTKYSRDCHLSGEYLAGLCWPIVDRALTAAHAAGMERAAKIADMFEDTHDTMQEAALRRQNLQGGLTQCRQAQTAHAIARAIREAKP